MPAGFRAGIFPETGQCDAIMRIIKPVCLVGWLLLSLPASAGEANWQQTRFHEVDTVFANPGQGWMSRRFPSSVAYLRFQWADVEPAMDHYDWRIIDAAMAEAKSRGASLSLRVMTASAHSHGYYCSPKWLFALGCKGFEYTVGGADPTAGGRRIPRIEPDYADPLYLTKHGEFIAALGKRYDGNPDVEFVDIGSYGIWGEWHSPHPVSAVVRRRIVDMYLQAFRRTPLVGMVDDEEALAYVLAHGGGYRCDGIGSPQIENRWVPEAGGRNPFYLSATSLAMKDAWLKAPVVFEWYGSFDYLKSQGWSVDAAVDFMLSNHVTFINDNLGRVPAGSLMQLQRLTLRAGYRFVLRDIALEKVVAPGASLNIKMNWANVGVGKLYRACQLKLALRNAGGLIVASLVVPTDPREWLPGEREVRALLAIPPATVAGDYALEVCLTEAERPGRNLRLAMEAPMAGGWYQVSHIIVN